MYSATGGGKDTWFSKFLVVGVFVDFSDIGACVVCGTFVNPPLLWGLEGGAALCGLCDVTALVLIRQVVMEICN